MLRRSLLVLAVSALPAVAADGWRPDPFMAGLLSWTMPGTGQIYAEAWTKGSLLLMAELGNKALLAGLLFRINDRYGRTVEGQTGVIAWERLRLEDRVLLGGYLVLSSAFRVWNAWDAVRTAQGWRRPPSAEAFPEEGTGWVPEVGLCGERLAFGVSGRF